MKWFNIVKKDKTNWKQLDEMFGGGDSEADFKEKEDLKNFLVREFKFSDDSAATSDMEAAIYWYASDYHRGQKSHLYRVLSTSEYKPGALAGVEEEDPIVLEMYEYLVEEFNNKRYR